MAKDILRLIPVNILQWNTDFSSMALKTVLRNLITRWGIMSVEMVQAVDRDIEAETQMEIAENANAELLSIDDDEDIVDAEFVETQHVEEQQQEELSLNDPGF